MNEASSFGQWLRQARAERDLTQEVLAELVGCAVQTVRTIERGTRRPSAALAERMLTILGVPHEQQARLLRLARMPLQPAVSDDSLPEGVQPAREPGPHALLATKLYRPSLPARAVERDRLVARLETGRSGRLTLIAAPAGFGKTTLLSAWLGGDGSEAWGKDAGESAADRTARRSTSGASTVAWLSLDETDNDPVTFLRYLIAALQPVGGGVGALALALLDAPAPAPLTAALTALINDLAALPQRGSTARQVLLVLDDYHVITTPAIHEALGFLLDHLPSTLHLVIASREDPPLHLARWRARGQVNELRAADLRFTRDEAAAFLRDVMELGVSADDVAALETRTEGWIAGLQLAALALRDRADITGFIAAFTGSNRFVIDYLSGEVLERLPPTVRTFMLQTSILDRLCGPLCDYVMADGPAAPADEAGVVPPADVMLEALERANVFLVPLDDDRHWYRYHRLFAEVLQSRLARQLEPAAIAALHRRASSWFEQQEERPAAIQHALLAHDWYHAATLIEAVALPLTMDGQQITVDQWLKALPQAMRQDRPRLAVAQAYVAAFNNDFAAADLHLRQAEAGLSGQDGVQAAGIEAEVMALRTTIFSMLGDPRAIEMGQRALERLPAAHPLRPSTTGGLCFVAFSNGDLAMTEQLLQETVTAHQVRQSPSAIQVGWIALLAMVRRAQGRLRDVRRLAGEALELSTEHGRVLPVSGAFLAYLLLGLTQCEQNELDAAEQTLRRCAELATEYGVKMYELLARYYLGHVLAARGELAAALALVEAAEAAAPPYLSPTNLRELEGFRVMLWLRQGEIARAAAWAAEHQATVKQGRPRFTAYDNDRFAIARTAMALGDLLEARTAISCLREDAAATGHGRYVIWALVWDALIAQQQGDLAGALGALERALELAEPEGYMRVFVDEGAPMAQLLQIAHARGLTPAYITLLLDAMPHEERETAGHPEPLPGTVVPAAGRRPTPGASPLLEPLTPREDEVLRLIAAGESNRAIATRLILSLGTVKKYVHTICGKLGVTSRTQAIARAREIGLL